jgi:hypothetical protein
VEIALISEIFEAEVFNTLAKEEFLKPDQDFLNLL